MSKRVCVVLAGCGVYDGTQRRWRVRAKHHISCACAYDLDLDGDRAVRRPELSKAFAAKWSSALAPLSPAEAASRAGNDCDSSIQ